MPDAFPVMFDKKAAVPMPLSVVVGTESLVDYDPDMLLSRQDIYPMDRPGMCCVRLDDFDWVVPHYDPDTLLSGRDMEVGVTDISQDIRVLPDAFPVMFDEKTAVPMSLPVDDTDVIRDILLLSDDV